MDEANELPLLGGEEAQRIGAPVLPSPVLAHLGGHPGAAGWGGGGFGAGGGGAGAGAVEEGGGLTAAHRMWVASLAAEVRTRQRLGAMRGSLLATVASLHRLLGAAGPHPACGRVWVAAPPTGALPAASGPQGTAGGTGVGAASGRRPQRWQRGAAGVAGAALGSRVLARPPTASYRRIHGATLEREVVHRTDPAAAAPAAAPVAAPAPEADGAPLWPGGAFGSLVAAGCTLFLFCRREGRDGDDPLGPPDLLDFCGPRGPRLSLRRAG